MYIFDGNAVVINIRGEARDKHKYHSILIKAVCFALGLFIVFASICYSVFREESKPIFSMNLTPVTPFVIFIFICICINALTSYPVQVLAAFTIIEKTDVFTRSNSRLELLSKKLFSRTVIIVSTTIVSMLVPSFTDFINIAGSIGSAGVAFIIP